MSQGREPVEPETHSEADEQQHGTPDVVPMPRIQGVRAAGSFEQGARVAKAPPIMAEVTPDHDGAAPQGGAVDPWGLEDAQTLAPPGKEDDESADGPEPRSRGGGALTIPLLCAGIALIACVTLLPLADDNHRLAWEREKLLKDLAQLKEQTRVNEEFLQRVADDPTLAERLAQRQMKYYRQGTQVLNLRGSAKEEMSPFHLVAVPPPEPLPPYQPVGGALANLVRAPRSQLYLSGGALLLIATGLVLGYVPKEK